MAVSLGGYGLPGMSDIIETAEREILWGNNGNEHAPAIYKGVVLNSGTVDSTNTTTTNLRPGLILADLGTGEWKNYDPASSTAAQRIPAGILAFDVNMIDPDTGSAASKYVPILVGGAVIASKLPNLDYWARSVLARQFLFNDVLGGFRHGYRNEVNKVANYTVTAAECGVLFTTGTGAVTFTLPAIAKGLYFEFLNLVNANMTVASAEGDNMVALNDAAADSFAASTTSEKVGAWLRVIANQAGTLWYVQNLSAGANTITIAT